MRLLFSVEKEKERKKPLAGVGFCVSSVSWVGRGGAVAEGGGGGPVLRAEGAHRVGTACDNTKPARESRDSSSQG